MERTAVDNQENLTDADWLLERSSDDGRSKNNRGHVTSLVQ